MAVQESEGEAPFEIPELGKPAKTWHKVFGDLNSSKRPLIVLHGGPGCCHGMCAPKLPNIH